MAQYIPFAFTRYSAQQRIFATSSVYSPEFGGVYFADFICEKEAKAAGLAGTWKALVSDEATSAKSRLTFNAPVLNYRPTASGGAQTVAANSVAFWSGTWANSVSYTAAGASAPTYGWTGTTSTGAISTGYTCSSWTSVAGSGAIANTGGTSGSNLDAFTNSCSIGNVGALYCVNGQSSAAPPPDVSGLTVDPGSTTAGFSWSTSGTTGGVQIAYQAGPTAPADCNSGTVLTPFTVGLAPFGAAISGLSPSTQYSARICASNSDATSLSAGVTTTFTTGTSDQQVFATAATFGADFGGLNYGDFLCQNAAHGAGLSGTWKALLSDETTNAKDRINIASPILNVRPSGSGGPQVVAANATAFWSGNWVNAVNYSETGSGSAAYTWTGSSPAGLLAAGYTCSSWTSVSGVGNYGVPGSINSGGIDRNLIGCATHDMGGLYCINEQSSAAAPPDVSGLTVSPGATAVGFSWTTSGSAAGAQIAYQAGATAPADCNSGTVLSPFSVGLAPLGAAITGLSPSTQYSARICASNSDASALSSGVTATFTTGTTDQRILATSANYTGNFGGLYFADFACQKAANAGGLNGTWKALISDETTDVKARISVSSPPLNFRPSGSGGPQVVAANANALWTSNWLNAVGYDVSGTPTSVVVWTGGNANGVKSSGNTCSSWTTTSGNGNYGRPDFSYESLDWNYVTCSYVSGFICTNEQASAAAPNEVINPSATVNSTSQITLNFASGGGTTAAYEIAYQTGPTAPADCNSGTTISAYTIGVNPTSYAVTGLTTGTQYSFRICAANSDLSSVSAGVTVSATTN